MIRPLGDRLIVRMDPPPTVSVLYLPNGWRIRTGEVLSVGPGRTTKKGQCPLDVRPGERVAFFRENMEHQQGKAITSLLADLGDSLGVLRESDVLFVLPPGWQGKLS